MYQAEITALLFVAGDQGISEKELLSLLDIDKKTLKYLLSELEISFDSDERLGFRLAKFNSTYKLVTKSEYSDILNSFFESGLGTKLSQAALEVLSIVAYRQPITRVEVDEIRGVQSSGSMNTLIARDLIKEKGKKDVPGHPNLYVVTEHFFDYFGIRDIKELPDFESFENIDIYENEENLADGEN
ncbi:SMC-Scp complex subunit ScpB [Companilactobacillus metriopterae]|uniref:SMC-Scp complex subunit ScpB n=1 Tax=Companilactobacillus metriopterae TaxID=1909267 RepID=UPI00100C2F01|nr:SMC-Scp complex subunit ScpB [Companilactobacillus metriopterae]